MKKGVRVNARICVCMGERASAVLLSGVRLLRGLAAADGKVGGL